MPQDSSAITCHVDSSPSQNALLGSVVFLLFKRHSNEGVLRHMLGLGQVSQTLHLVHFNLVQSSVFILFLSILYFLGRVLYFSLVFLYFFEESVENLR